MLPSAKQDAQNEGEVLAVGPGRRSPHSGERLPLWAAVGKQVLYSRYATKEVSAGGEDYALLRDDDVLLGYDGVALTLEGIEMPYGKILVRLLEEGSESDGGILLSKAAAKPDTTVGIVVVASDGLLTNDGTIRPLDVEVGDAVRFTYGSEVALEMGKADYRVISVDACLAKWKL